MAEVPLPTPTDNAVPSTDIRDSVYAGAMLDKVVTSTELTYTDRLGGEHYTVDGIKAEGDKVVEETRQNLIPLSRQYMTLAEAQADIVNIPVGSTTYYRSPDDSALAVEVINNAGTLEPTGRKMPSQASVDSASEKATLALESVPVERVLPELVPVVQDSVGKVALWLEDGDLNGKGVTREFADKSAAASSIVTGISEMVPSESVTPQLVPVVQDAEGKVSIWLENGDLAVKGISDDTSDKVATSGTILPEKVAMLPSEEVAPSLIPLVQDADGNVSLWLENGDFVARGLGSSLIDIISAALSGVFQKPLKYTDARTAWRWRTAKSKYKLSVTSKLKVGFTGDSWTEKKAIPQMMANIL
ncbi:TPA: hypothetical protein ACX4I9_000001, partial [Klebsiella pneumoniae]